MDNNKSYLGRVKEAVDFIYSLVNEEPDGYSSGFATCDTIVKRVVSVLVRRGALCRENAGANGNKGRGFIYKWGSNMAPTNNLYKVVMGELQEKKKRKTIGVTAKGIRPHKHHPISMPRPHRKSM